MPRGILDRGSRESEGWLQWGEAGWDCAWSSTGVLQRTKGGRRTKGEGHGGKLGVTMRGPRSGSTKSRLELCRRLLVHIPRTNSPSLSSPNAARPSSTATAPHDVLDHVLSPLSRRRHLLRQRPLDEQVLHWILLRLARHHSFPSIRPIRSRACTLGGTQGQLREPPRPGCRVGTSRRPCHAFRLPHVHRGAERVRASI